jgi:hypothetical protein
MKLSPYLLSLTLLTFVANSAERQEIKPSAAQVFAEVLFGSEGSKKILGPSNEEIESLTFKLDFFKAEDEKDPKGKESTEGNMIWMQDRKLDFCTMFRYLFNSLGIDQKGYFDHHARVSVYRKAAGTKNEHTPVIQNVRVDMETLKPLGKTRGKEILEAYDKCGKVDLKLAALPAEDLKVLRETRTVVAQALGLKESDYPTSLPESADEVNIKLAEDEIPVIRKITPEEFKNKGVHKK